MIGWRGHPMVFKIAGPLSVIEDIALNYLEWNPWLFIVWWTSLKSRQMVKLLANSWLLKLPLCYYSQHALQLKCTEMTIVNDAWSWRHSYSTALSSSILATTRHTIHPYLVSHSEEKRKSSFFSHSDRTSISRRTASSARFRTLVAAYEP